MSIVPTTIIPSIIAAQAAQQRKEERTLLDVFRLAGATAPERAQSLDRLGLTWSDALGRLEEAGVVRAAGRGRYYLDEAAVVARREARSTPKAAPMLLLVLAVLLALGIILLAVVGRGT